MTAMRMPIMARAFPGTPLRKRVSARPVAPVGLTRVYVQRRGQHGPAVTARQTLRRFGERADPGVLRTAVGTGMVGLGVAVYFLRVPATLTEHFVHAVPL